MKILLLSICFGLLSLNAYSQSKLVGAGKATKVGGSATSKTTATKKPGKTTMPVKKIPSQNPTTKQDPNAKYASSGYMEISGVSFANTDYDGHIIDDYGANLYASEVKYLTPKVFYRGLTNEKKEVAIDVKIINEDGTLKTGSSSPEGYTHSCKCTIEPGEGKFLILNGWGNNTSSTYTSGQYKLEIWHNGNILYQKGIRLYSGSTPLATSKILKITSVTFSNESKDGTVITDFGDTLYEGEVQYVTPKIYYTGLYANNQNVTLYYKFFSSAGSLINGNASPLCYSNKQDIVVKPGTNSLKLAGWGSSSGTTYKKGIHKVEYWLDGEKIYETTFVVKKKNDTATDEVKGTNIIDNHEYVDLGLPSGTKWATCNLGAIKPEEYGKYYAWGETTTKTVYTHSNSKYYNKSESWLKNNGVIDDSGNLNSTYDPVCQQWGSSWRMPTLIEMNELDEKCKWVWTTVNGINGYKVIGPNKNYIFLPASGWYNSASSGGIDCVNERSEYWTSTVVVDTESARCLFFMDNTHWANEGNNVQRSRGLTIRPVSK